MGREVGGCLGLHHARVPEFKGHISVDDGRPRSEAVSVCYELQTLETQ